MVRAASAGDPAPALAAATACDTAGVPTSTAYLPNITKTLGGPSGWVTPFIVQNVGAAATTLEVSYYRFGDGTLVTCRKVAAVAPGTSFSEVPNENADLADDSQFSVVVRSFGAQVVAVVNEQQGSGATAEALSYSGLSAGATRLALPYVADQVSGWLTTLVIQNLGVGTASVSASFANADGTKTATLARSIAPGRSTFVDPRFEPSLATGTEYAVTLAADQPIAAIANAHNDAAGVAAPMGFSYNAVVVGSAAQMYLPYAARNGDGIGRTSRIVVQNAGSVDATPTLTFQKLGGAPSVAVSAPQPVKPGRSWSFDVRFAADGVTACPVGGGPSCVAEGEHSLFTSGGVFAVLDMTLSPATAMGYIGAAPSPSRVYLPNVTRTLGGTAGWTTPIIVQSAGTTSAQLRWFRFADGSLVQTQSLTGLSAGASQRVDPRTVAGLAESTQYAVVIDAPGPVTAIVTELNFLGGDSAMIYEGFPSTQSATPVAATATLAPATATLQRGATQQFAATVKDQFGATMGAVPTAWSVTPSTLGTVDSTGLFTAGQAGGTGTVTATAAGVGGTAAVTVQVPATATIGGITFRVTASASADTYVETTISDADAQTITALIEPAVTSVQTAYARTYATRPQFYAFATTASFASGWTTVLGGLGTPNTGANGAFFEGSKKIGLNWTNMKRALPYRSPRHEATHMMEHQIAGSGIIPAWFDEGSARLQDLTEPGGTYRINESRYETATLAANGLLFAVTLSDSAFYALGALEENYAYYESAETVRLMRDDLGQASLDRLLELIAQGQSFTAAYQTVSGRTWDSSLATRQARLRALSSSYPGVVTAQDTFQGPGLNVLLYGFTPSSSVTLTITVSGRNPSLSTVTADKYGAYSTYLGSTWPTGSYTITAADPNGTATANAVKATSFVESEFPLGLVEPAVRRALHEGLVEHPADVVALDLRVRRAEHRDGIRELVGSRVGQRREQVHRVVVRAAEDRLVAHLQLLLHHRDRAGPVLPHRRDRLHERIDVALHDRAVRGHVAALHDDAVVHDG